MPNSDVALPLAVRMRLLPLTELGRAIVCTSVPAGVYSSRKTSAAAADSGADPSPTRATTRLPGLNGAAKAADPTEKAAPTKVRTRTE